MTGTTALTCAYLLFLACRLSPPCYLPPVTCDLQMIIARVVGTVVATRKDERLVSSKLLVARPLDPSGTPDGNYLVAIDTVDAGVGETVLIVSGSSARMASGLKDTPVDAAIVGVIDQIDIPRS